MPAACIFFQLTADFVVYLSPGIEPGFDFCGIGNQNRGALRFLLNCGA